MEYITDNKLSYYGERCLWNKKPITAEMIMTNFCNYNCEYCRYLHGSGYFKIDDFINASERLVEMGVRGYILTGGGEPMLNPDIEKILNYLDNRGLKYGINTNGTMFVPCKAEWVKVSIHKNDEKVYQNIGLFKEYAAVVGIQSIIKNKNDILKFYEAYKNLDVDYIIFRPIEATGGGLYSERDISEMLNVLFQLKKDDNRVKINYKLRMVWNKFKDCHANWCVITVDYDLNVWYCCHKPSEIMGSVFDLDILEKKAKHITDMEECDVPCRMTDMNMTQLKIMQSAHHIEFL